MNERCAWAEKSDLYRAYHDEEWGVPLHDDRMLFEFIVLEGAQAGLSWETILNKRVHYRRVFDAFDPVQVAGYNDRKVAELLADPGIVRNRAKIAAAIGNARAFLDLRNTHGSFDKYIWQFTGGGTVQNRWERMEQVPAISAASEVMSKTLKAAGFRFVGPTICYAFMQATGMVNDHLVSCIRHGQLG